MFSNAWRNWLRNRLYREGYHETRPLSRTVEIGDSQWQARIAGAVRELPPQRALPNGAIRGSSARE